MTDTPASQPSSQSRFIEAGQRTIAIEKEAIAALIPRVDQAFSQACDALLRCQGRVVVMGIGKSGHIAKKIAATLASTGTPAFFVHPAEANHGDLGMITREDVVIAISNSGQSNEIISLLPLLKRLDIALIALTGNPSSALAQASDAHINIAVASEACPLNLAPTSSTTATLVMGDAIAVALLEARGFSAEDFAFSHPGGTLGRKLLVRVSDLMHSDTAMPCVTLGTSLADTLVEMGAKGLGIAAVINDANALEGVFTDGDLRRHIDLGNPLKDAYIDDLMSLHPKTVGEHQLAAQALHQMETLMITALIVINDDDSPIGVIHLHDILRAGVV